MLLSQQWTTLIWENDSSASIRPSVGMPVVNHAVPAQLQSLTVIS